MKHNIITLLSLWCLTIMLWGNTSNPIPEAEELSDSIPSIEVDTFPPGLADTLHRALYQERPLVRPINHSQP